MKSIVLFLLCLCVRAEAASTRGELALPLDYKERIETAIHAKEPETGEIALQYDQPARVLVGEAKKAAIAVRCHWTPAHKATTFTTVFLFDHNTMSEAGRFDRVEWVEGQPVPENRS